MENNDADRLLQQLVEKAQQHPPLSQQRQLALNKLVSEITRSPRLSYPQQESWPHHIYQDLHNEALQKTLLQICQNIDKYNPQYPVMSWVNELLRYRFIDTVRDYYQQTPAIILSLDQLNYEPPAADRDSFDSDTEMLAQFLQEDPENILQATSIRGRKDVTLQVLLCQKFVEDKTWEEISQQLGVPLQTVVSFVNRNLQKFTYYFRKYLQE